MMKLGHLNLILKNDILKNHKFYGLLALPLPHQRRTFKEYREMLKTGFSCTTPRPGC